jgi:hypothetical protein
VLTIFLLEATFTQLCFIFLLVHALNISFRVKKQDNFSNILLMSLLALNQFLLIKITMTGSSKKAIAKVLLGYQQSRGLQQLLNVL